MRISLPWMFSGSTNVTVSPSTLPSFNSASRFWSSRSDVGFAGHVRAVLLEREGVFLQAALRVELGFPSAGDIRRQSRE